VAAADQLTEMIGGWCAFVTSSSKPSSCRKGTLPGAIHSSIGQEGAIVGACMALRGDDYMTGNHRSHGHPIAKGSALPPLMAELSASFGVTPGLGGQRG